MKQITYSEKDIEAFKKLSSRGPLGKRALFIMQKIFLKNGFREMVQEVRKEIKIDIENGYYSRSI